MSETMMDAARRRLRVAFVPGVTPDKWFRIWRERVPDAQLIPVPLDSDEEQLAAVTEGHADMVLARLPVDAADLHVIPLYTEQPVVVAAKGHAIEAADAVDVSDLGDEHLVQHPDSCPEWRAIAREVTEGTRVETSALTPRQAIDVVAAGTGIAVVPLSVARQFDRKDVVRRPVTGVAETHIALCWPAGDDSELIEQFIGVVRGRSAQSTRSRGSVEAQEQAAKRRAAEKKDAARNAAERTRERKHAERVARRKSGGGKRGRRR